MDICLLGPLEVWADGHAVPLGTPKQRTTFALLAANADRFVGVEELIGELWPSDPPASAVANVRGYVAGLRRVLASEQGRKTLVRRTGGYLLQTTHHECDLTTFEMLADEGRTALRDGDPTLAVGRLAAARRCWRGPMLADVPRGLRLQARCTMAEQELASVTEHLAQAYLALNQPDEAVLLLREQVRLHPLREAAHALLMRALCRVGDSAAALAAFGDARRILVDQIGIEPGAELQELQRAILDGDRTPRAGTAARPGVLVPRELPPDASPFVGRAPELDQAHSVLVRGTGSRRRRPAVLILHGPGGAGKSALAVRIAHQVAGHFPDGQLYVDLFGSTPGRSPRSVPDVLSRLLRGLGVRPDSEPRYGCDAAAELRTVTADRRLLVVLDNAEDAEQVHAVLPASGSCGVVVTARRPLSEVDADCRMRIAGLSPTDGLALLERLAPRVAADRAAARRVVDLCERLPLAIRIAAGRLTRRPDVTAHDFAERLADRRNRLDELALDGLTLRSSLRASYEALAASKLDVRRLAAEALRALGVHDGAHVDEDVVADALGCGNSARVRAVLDVLVGDELVEPLPGGGYRLPDLVRLVAAEIAAEPGLAGDFRGATAGQPGPVSSRARGRIVALPSRQRGVAEPAAC